MDAIDDEKQGRDEQEADVAPPDESAGGLGDIDQLFHRIVEKDFVQRHHRRDVVHNHRIGNQ